jgi:hypothetical protein
MQFELVVSNIEQNLLTFPAIPPQRISNRTTDAANSGRYSGTDRLSISALAILRQIDFPDSPEFWFSPGST